MTMLDLRPSGMPIRTPLGAGRSIVFTFPDDQTGADFAAFIDDDIDSVEHLVDLTVDVDEEAVTVTWTAADTATVEGASRWWVLTLGGEPYLFDRFVVSSRPGTPTTDTVVVTVDDVAVEVTVIGGTTGGGGGLSSVTTTDSASIDFTGAGTVASPLTGTVITEAMQDIVGAMAIDSATVDFTYDDTAGTLTAVVQGLASGDLSDFAEAVRDRLGSTLVAGTGVSVTVDDLGDTVTVASTVTQYTDEMARDALGAALVEGANIDVTVDDTANTITVAVTGLGTAATHAHGDYDAAGAAATAQAAAVQRANHTGTQTASTVSDFDTQVRTSRLDQMAAPTADVPLNTRKITGLADPTLAQDAATRAYVLAVRDALVASAPGLLDTLDELAAALGDDPNFATTVTNALAGKQPLDTDLTALAALVSAADKLPYATGTGTWSLSDFTAFARTLLDDANAATARTTLGLGTAATHAHGDYEVAGAVATHEADTTSVHGITDTTALYRSGGTDVAVADGGTGSSTAAGARTNLGLVIGTDVQAQDTDLTAIAALVSAADKLPYATGAGTWSLADITTIARTLLANSTAGQMRSTMGLVIGTNVQPNDAELTAIAGLTSAADRLPYFTGSGTASLATFTAAGRALVDDADAAAQLVTLGAVAKVGDTVTGTTPIALHSANHALLIDGHATDTNALTIHLPSGTPSGYGKGNAIVILEAGAGNATDQTETGSMVGRWDINGIGVTSVHITPGFRNGLAPTQGIWVQNYRDATGIVLQGHTTQTANFVTAVANNGSTLLFEVDGAGQVRAAAGSAALPAYSFVGDPNTGMFNTPGDYLGFSTAGTMRCYLDPAGTLIMLYPLQLNDQNMVFGTTTGTKLGTATNQKLAFYNATPIAQRAGAAQVAVATTAATNVTPYGFSTAAQADAIVTLANELRAAAVALGLIKGAA